MFVQHIEGDAGAVIAVQPLPLGGRSLSSSLSSPGYTRGAYQQTKGHSPSPSAGGPTMESHDNSDNATSNQPAWQFATPVS